MTVQTQTQRVDNEIVLLDMINSRGKFTNVKSAEKFLRQSLRKVNQHKKKIEVTPENLIHPLAPKYISYSTLRETQAYIGIPYIPIKELNTIEKSRWLHLGLSYEGYREIIKLKKFA